MDGQKRVAARGGGPCRAAPPPRSCRPPGPRSASRRSTRAGPGRGRRATSRSGRSPPGRGRGSTPGRGWRSRCAAASMSPGSTTTPSAAMISWSVSSRTPRKSRPRWCSRSTSTPRPCTPWKAMCSRPEVLGEGGVAGTVTGRVRGGADQVDAGPVAVVVHGLLDPVAIGVELGAHVGQRVPLGRVLQRQGDHVVGPDVDVLGVAEVGHLAHVDVVEGAGVALHVLGGRQPRWRAPLVEDGAAGEVEGQAQAEADARLHLADAFEHLVGGHQVDATELVVVAEVAPRRAFWASASTAWSCLPLVQCRPAAAGP